MNESNINHRKSSDNVDSSIEKRNVLGLVAKLGELTLPAHTEEQASILEPEHFEGRLPLTVAEENRFVELFGYYPGGLGL